MSDVTRILTAIERGDAQATDDLLPVVYNESAASLPTRCRRSCRPHSPADRARSRSMAEARGFTRSIVAKPRSLFGAAAEAMRRILIASARRKQTQRRGARAQHLELDDLEIASPAPDDQLLALNEALDRFAASNRSRLNS